MQNGLNTATPLPYRHRAEERPKIIIEFNADEFRQQFIDEVITDLRTPAPGRQPFWRNVAAWSTGGALQ